MIQYDSVWHIEDVCSDEVRLMSTLSQKSRRIRKLERRVRTRQRDLAAESIAQEENPTSIDDRQGVNQSHASAHRPSIAQAGK